MVKAEGSKYHHTVRINQVETDLNCPAAHITAYVSVTDQGGYAVKNLTDSNFSVFEDDARMVLTDFSFVSQVFKPTSVAMVLDYSGSITKDVKEIMPCPYPYTSANGDPQFYSHIVLRQSQRNQLRINGHSWAGLQ